MADKQGRHIIIEAGQSVTAGLGGSPAERDLLSLTQAPFDEIVEAFEGAPAHGPDEGLPDRSVQIARFITARSVGFIRLGSPSEIHRARMTLLDAMDNSKALSDEPRGGYGNKEGHSLVMAATRMLGAAGVHSAGYELNLIAHAPEDLPLFKVLHFIDRANQSDPSDFPPTPDIAKALNPDSPEHDQAARSVASLDNGNLIRPLGPVRPLTPTEGPWHVTDAINLPIVRRLLHAAEAESS